MARNPHTPDCGLDGCERAVHRGKLCKKHYAIVPFAMKLQCNVDCARASYDAAKGHHTAQLEYVRGVVGTPARV